MTSTNTTYEYPEHCGFTHKGYLDGILGRDPNPRCTGWDDYDTGWLHGDADKNDPAKRAALEGPSFGKGDTVTVPKGVRRHSMKDGWRAAAKTHTVKLHDVYPPRQARIDHQGAFVPPTPAEALWAGTGGYWMRANALDLQKLPA